MIKYLPGFLMADCMPTNLVMKPLLALVLRVWVAKVFFFSALTKIKDWDTTLILFQYEYAVPLLPPTLAAWMGTAAELILPVLLVAGFLTRPAALALFLFNIVAVISYAGLSPAGIQQHVFWGVMIAVTFVYGPGQISLDYLSARYLKNRCS